MNYYTNIDDRLYRATCGWTNGPKYIVAHESSPQSVIDKATYVGLELDMIVWVEECKSTIATIYVVCPSRIVYNEMKKRQPKLNIFQI
jgi:hypothetical protein